MGSTLFASFELYSVRMFIHEPFAYIRSINKRMWIGGVVILISFIAFGGYLLSTFGTLLQETPDPEVEIKPIKVEQNTPSLLCDVSGAVNKPGLVVVTQSMRVADAITSAGGLTKDADLEAISATINLSEKVKDEQKIVVPFKNSVRVSATSRTQVQKISINTASSSELEKLAGIGPVKAAQIISERPFTKVDALVEKKIISKKAFDALSEKISL